MTENTDLQFDRAQFDEPAPKPECHVCATPLYSSYFEVNGETVCEGCCYKLREATPIGSRPGRVLRATAAGIGAGLAGAALYWAIIAATGYEFALIAIVVGYAVGKAVHWGSRGRGGWAYQGLAMGLTYLAIVGAYVPMIFMMPPDPTAETQTASQDAETAPDATPATVEVVSHTPTTDTPTTDTPTTDTQTTDTQTTDTQTADTQTADTQTADTPTTEATADDGKPMGPGSFLFGLGALLLLVCALPFLGGVQNIMGIIIIGIGVYEAWKLNRRAELVITGPHALAASRAATIGS